MPITRLAGRCIQLFNALCTGSLVDDVDAQLGRGSDHTLIVLLASVTMIAPNPEDLPPQEVIMQPVHPHSLFEQGF